MKNKKKEISSNETISLIIFRILNNTSNKNDQKINDISKYLFEENLQSKQLIDIFNSIFITEETYIFHYFFSKINLDSSEHICFKSKALEILLACNSFDDNKFNNCIKDFSKVSFELQTSTINFKDILMNISKLKTKLSKKTIKLLILLNLIHK